MENENTGRQVAGSVCLWSLLATISIILVTGPGIPSGCAQVTASISGRVLDPSGAAVPGAAVTVTSVETGAVRTVEGDAGGSYRVLSLPVGAYEIRAEKPGFQVAVRRGVNLAVGQEAVVTLTLQVGEVAQQLTVTAEAPVVNTTTASVSGLVGEKQVKDLPLNGRSFDNLIALNASSINYTSMTPGAQTGSGPGSSFSVAGRRPMENLFLLNGVEYTGLGNVEVSPGGVSQQLLGIDAVREFNVMSDSYSAEYGKRAGAQINIVTQSGTNALHGTMFEFLRNSSLDARNFFDYPAGIRIPPFRRNQFGGALGGPIQKDKTFLFGNYEGFRQRLAISDVTIVPDANARQGLLPNAQGVPTPVSGLNSGMLPYMIFWPVPNGPTLGGGAALAYSNPRQAIREDFATTRLDRTFSEKDSLSGVYTIDDGENTTPSADPVFGTFTTLRTQIASVQETHIFSPRVLNTVLVGFTRAGFFFDSPPLTPFPPSFSFFTGKEPGGIIIGGASGLTLSAAITPAGSTSNANIHNYRNLFTYGDNLQVIRGRHQISAGVWFQRLRLNQDNASQKTGRAQFSSLTTFLQGTVATFSGAPNTTALGWRSLEGAWYLQDSITLRPNLQLRLGLRHEFDNGYNEQFNRAVTFVYDANGVLLTTPRAGQSLFDENHAHLLFGPRIGLAWDPYGKGKTSIRAGAGTYYDLQDNPGFLPMGLPPYNGVISFQGVPFLSVVPVVSGAPFPPTCGPGVPQPCTTFAPQGFQSTAKTPTVEEWNFSVEQQITPSMALRLGYVGNRGYHQLLAVDPNTVRPQICSNPGGCTSGGVGAARGSVPQGAQYIPVGTRPNPFLANGFFYFFQGNSSYNALQVDVRQRFSKGLQFRFNYTWSRNLDLNSALGSALAINEPQMILDPHDLHRDWGPASLNVTHQASGNFSYELPFGKGKPWLGGVSGAANKLASGWQFNGILTLLSGFPLTPIVGSNQSGDGDARTPDRPNVNPDFRGPVILGKVDQWFNPHAFLLPTPGTYGNLGRGTLYGPGLAAVDLSLFKSTAISERMNLQFRAECFNLINHANFGVPNQTVFTSGAINPTAGIITSTATTSRQVQFGMKLVF